MIRCPRLVWELGITNGAGNGRHSDGAERSVVMGLTRRTPERRL
jgi:hypothetical protein